MVNGQSGDSMGRGSGYLKHFEKRDGGREHELTRQGKILSKIVSEPIPFMALIVQHLGEETVESTKEHLRNLITMPENKDEFISLQNRLDNRSDFTNQTLLKCHKIQLEVLVAIKTGLGSFLSGKIRLPTTELVEVFLLERCRNIDCRRLLRVEDCDCKICSTKKGFCSECMCSVCLNFDRANNTCSWVGCDACLHWCHAVCAIRRNLIKPCPSSSGTTELQFYCLGCGHASQMFGFIKDVFMSCAKEWDEETLMKELDCVRKIFQRSEDLNGKELHVKADVLHRRLVMKMISPSDACNFIFQFFSGSDGLSNFSSSDIPPTDFNNDLPASTSLIGGERSVNPSKKDLVDSLGSFVRIKQAEAQMFQYRADDTRREAESLRRLAWLKSRQLEEEYSEKISKLRLQEIEEKRKKKAEELKALENSHSDCNELKTRMHMELSAILSRMEAAKKPLAAMACRTFLLLLFLQQPSRIELVVFGNMQLLIFLHLPPFLANLPYRCELFMRMKRYEAC